MKLATTLRSLFAFLCLSVVAQAQTTYTVTTTADTGAGSFRDAIDTVNATNTYTSIVFAGSLAGQTISMTNAFNPYSLLRPASGSLTIDGAAAAGVIIDGGGKNRPFFIYSGTILIKNLAVANVQARGGDGAGGGAGLGGAIFVYTGASLTVQNVSFSGCNATGGNGGVGSGGGGMGGNGGNSGGGGLGGDGGGLGGNYYSGGGGGGGVRSGAATAAGGSGGLGSANGGVGAAGGSGSSGGLSGGSASIGEYGDGLSYGGGGGGNNSGGGGGGGGSGGDSGGGFVINRGGSGGGGGNHSLYSMNANGGFGGGGGGSGSSMGYSGSVSLSGGGGGFGGGGGAGAAGGNGGFGGGGGIGSYGARGAGGFGGGGSPAGFGAGPGYIDIDGIMFGGGGGLGAGGSVFVMAGGSFTVIDPTFTGTAFSAVGGNGAQGIGSGFFLGGNASIQVSDGTTVTLPAVNDFIGGGADPNASGGLIKSGPGTLVMGGSSHVGGTTVTGGVLSISAENQLGAAGKPFTLNGGVLRVTGTSLTSFARPITLVSGGFDIADAGNTFTINEMLTGTGGLTKHGLGKLVLQGVTVFSGTSSVNAGTLQLDNGFGGGGGTLNVASGATLLAKGQVSSAISGAGTVTANGAPLVLGDLASANGFNLTGGTLNAGGNSVVLFSQGKALLGAATNLSSGATLVSVNGLQLGNATTLDATKVMTVTGPATIQGAFTNNGTVDGPTVTGEALTMLNTVNGAGSFTGNTVFKGGYSPGNSPAAVTLQNVTFAPGHILTLELGGTAQGTEYDHLNVTGSANLGGSLVVQLIGGFQPAAGDRFDLLDGAVKGGFSRIIYPPLAEGLAWDTSQFESAGILTVTKKP